MSVFLDEGQEFVAWEFDGEYWRDELGSYRQVIRSACSEARR